MGFCSYCYRSVGRNSYGYSNECFGWDEARACSGITGPDDPIRVARKRENDRENAATLRAEARAILHNARQRAGQMREKAAQYEREARKART